MAHLVRADALVLLSDVDSLYDGPPSHGAKRIPHVAGPHDLDGVSIGRAGKAGVGTGGMLTKVEAASIAAGSGIHALVTSTANAAAALAGEDVGTWFSINGARKPIRLLWLAHLASVQGTLVLDDGAVRPCATATPHCCRPASPPSTATSKPATPWKWCRATAR